MNQKQMLSIVREQLATDLNCRPDDFSKEGFIFCEAKENPGRRPFPRNAQHFEMLTMGKSVVVSATPEILTYVQEQLKGKSRDEAFSMPFVYGQGLYFLPDHPYTPAAIEGIELSLIEKEEILPLYSLEGFPNAIHTQYDSNHPRPDVLVSLAKSGGQIIGMAGASADSDMMWQIGIDVLPEYRCKGVAAALVGKLTKEILRRGKIPYYGTASSNIASQRVAHRAGYQPAWMCVYRGRFDGIFTQPSG